MATGTQIEVVMPQMGVSVSEGTITKWLKQPGEAIAQDEPLLEISTDKVDTEVPSPGEGVVAEILVAEGETVDVGTLLAVIAPGRLRRGRACRCARCRSACRGRARGAGLGRARARRGARSPLRLLPRLRPQPTASGNGRTFVSPVVARIAAEQGVDPSVVPGTGTGGRVTKKDILAYIESGAAPAGGCRTPAARGPCTCTCACCACRSCDPLAAAPKPAAPAACRRAVADRRGHRSR